MIVNERRIQRLQSLVEQYKNKFKEEWYALEDAKPDEGVLVYVVGKFVEGLYLLQDNEWYSKEEVDNDPEDYASCVGLDYDAVTWWRTKPIPPSIENSKGE